jgi:hypothetical protein
VAIELKIDKFETTEDDEGEDGGALDSGEAFFPFTGLFCADPASICSKY